MNTIADYIFETEHRKNVHNLFEMSLISDIKDNLPKNTKIYVYGENDEQGTKPPHFHVRIDNRYEFEIKFDDFNSLEIWRSKNAKYDWENYSDVKKEIKNWLVSKNIETPEYTNMQVILTEWNRENPNHKIDKEFYINKSILEICAGSVESAIAARDGGAQRIELCAALEVGGVTPSAGVIAEARKVEGLTLNVIIRPRGGDFLYNEYEVACMEQDIRTCKQLGVDGVVIGALTAEGDIDTIACKRLIAAAGGMSITFHRAFDMCRDPRRALEELISLGCHRVLTSGQAATAQAGIPLLKELVEQSAGRIIIMPGCGVSSANAAAILQATGATEIHASARKSVGSGMLFRHSGVSMGNHDSDEFARKETDVNEVRAIVSSIL